MMKRIRVKLSLRPTYKGRLVKQQLMFLDGRIMNMVVMWEMGEDDPYPGEFALQPYSEENKKLFYDNGLMWIASGDVAELENGEGWIHEVT